ncbi:phage tail protein [Pseudomonas sp. ZS1P83]
MPWYKSGTVSVTQNSNAVIGTGTAFIANSRVGDAFRGPDGGWYEVTNIASDTALSISPNYQGVTNAAGVYALAPMQGYVKDSADALRAMVNQFGAQLAALTNTDGLSEGATNKYFTDAKVRNVALMGFVTTDGTPVFAGDTVLSGLGKLQAQVAARLLLAGGKMTGAINDATPVALASAATVDIGAAASNVITISGTTTITGLGTVAAGARRTVRFTGALVLTHNATSLILQGGLNIATALNDSAEFLSLGGGNWICLRYNLANTKPAATVGTVSQSGGLPTGAIIETGSNANGAWTKWADGTMICTNRFGFNAGTSIATGGIFSTGTTPGKNFPVAFVGIPELDVGAYAIGIAVIPAALSDIASPVAWPSMLCFGPYSTTSFFQGIYNYVAIGRWF